MSCVEELGENKALRDFWKMSTFINDNGALAAKLKRNAVDSQRQEQADARRSLVGSGDRSERIRTYNFPQGRITDHRINLTLYKLTEVVSGEQLDDVIEPLIHEYQAEQLSALQDA